MAQEDEKQEQERDFKPISFFFESRSKIEIAGDGECSSFRGQGLGDLVLVAEALNPESPTWELVDLVVDSRDLVAVRMLSWFLEKDVRDLMFMVEPVRWASEWGVTRNPGKVSAGASGPGASRSAGLGGWCCERGCASYLCPAAPGSGELESCVLLLTLCSCVTLDESFDLSAWLVTI